MAQAQQEEVTFLNCVTCGQSCGDTPYVSDTGEKMCVSCMEKLEKEIDWSFYTMYSILCFPRFPLYYAQRDCWTWDKARIHARTKLSSGNPNPLSIPVVV